MRLRILLLLALLLLSGGLAFKLHLDAQTQATQSVAVADQNPQPAPHLAKTAVTPQHSRIEDEIGILSPFGPRLGRMADAFQEDLGIDLRIVTLNDELGSIETQSDTIFESKRIGVDAPTGGVLIILNPRLKQARIQVGYSLEGALTDLHMGRIARDQLAPYASYGVAGMAAMDVLHYLRDHVYAAAAIGNLQLFDRYKDHPTYQEFVSYASSGAGAKSLLSSVPLDADFKRELSAAERESYRPSSEVAESVAAFLRATRDFAGDPSLDLFTEGSRLMRAHYPLAPFEEIKRAERIEASMPLEYLIREDRAVVTSKKPAHGFLPILLRRDEGVWRVDLVETWKNLFYDREGNYYLRNNNTPYAFGLAQFGRGGYHDIAGGRFFDGSIEQLLSKLEARSEAVASLYRAEIWFRDCFVFPQAFLAYEEARRAAPKDPLMLQLFGDRALYLGFPELAIELLEGVGSGVELSVADAYYEIEDFENARRWVRKALDENPYELPALRRMRSLAQRLGNAEESLEVTQTIDALENDGLRRAEPVWLFFDPTVPNFEASGVIEVDGTKVFDHSHFGVTLQNRSNRAIQIESVKLTSVGTAAASGLGDIKGYWKFPHGEHRLLANQHVYFKKDWGFTVDTGHQHVRYVFRTCWHGVGTQVRQCRTQWVDTFPWTSLQGSVKQ